MKDPRETGPALLSVAQQQTLRTQGPPGAVQRNDRGGLSWMYQHQQGSVFGEQETIDVFVFDQGGLLLEQKTELRRSVGK